MTEKERANFAIQCSKDSTFQYLTIKFIGFDNTEFDTVFVKEYNREFLVDSFKIFVKPMSIETNNSQIFKLRDSEIHREFNVNHNYSFIIPMQAPFLLANMKMIMYPKFLYSTESYICLMGDFTINGVRYKNEVYPTFTKGQ